MLPAPRPRVSRETRLLLATVLLSLLALWVLARIRFPGRPATANPVPPVLFAPRPVFDDLANAVSEVQPGILRSLLRVDLEPPPAGQSVRPRDAVAALRFGQDIALALLRDGEKPRADGASLAAVDPVTGLAVLRVAGSSDPPPKTSTPAMPAHPQYVLASEVSRAAVSLQPVFLGSLFPERSPGWAASIWALPADPSFVPGTFVFTTSGALLGLVVAQQDGPAIVSAENVLAAARRLLEQGASETGWLGVSVQALSPEIARASGASSGVVVTWVDSRGPAFDTLFSTDVIEAVDGQLLTGREDWNARAARIAAGTPVALRIRRGGRLEEVHLKAAAPPQPAASPGLGLAMRHRAGEGAEVLQVTQDSGAARAGLQVGDLITRIGQTPAPTPAQVASAYASSTDAGVLVAVTRGEARLVVVLSQR
jgi:hypothetical protein